VNSEDGDVPRILEDAVDVIGETGAQNAGLVAIPWAALILDSSSYALALPERCFRYSSSSITYRLCVDLLGDFTALASQSTALRDFIRESNRGNRIWFLADLEELGNRLGAQESH